VGKLGYYITQNSVIYTGHLDLLRKWKLQGYDGWTCSSNDV